MSTNKLFKALTDSDERLHTARVAYIKTLERLVAAQRAHNRRATATAPC